jgi:hypothetical protein
MRASLGRELDGGQSGRYWNSHRDRRWSAFGVVPEVSLPQPHRLFAENVSSTLLLVSSSDYSGQCKCCCCYCYSCCSPPKKAADSASAAATACSRMDNRYVSLLIVKVLGGEILFHAFLSP